jgi:hypothetical protein
MPEHPLSEKYKDSFILVDKGDSLRHKHLRHCFVLLATELKETAKSDGKLALNVLESSGYYYDLVRDRGTIYSEDAWLLNASERNKYTVSCTPIVQERVLGQGRERDGVITVNDDEIQRIWNEIQKEMRDDAIKNPYYDRDAHNCCSVSFDSLRAIKKRMAGIVLLDLSGINKRSFNIFGRGIVFDNNDDSYFEYVKGGARLSSDLISVIPKVIVNKLSRENDDIKLDL